MHSIEQILSWPIGTNVPEFSGKIHKIGKYHEGKGVGDNGPFNYSFQDIEMSDASGRIVVCLKDRQELDNSWLNAEVVWTAGERNGKPIGIVTEDHAPRARGNGPAPRPYRRIKITGSAKMEDITGDAPPPQRRTAYDSAREAQGHAPAHSRQDHTQGGQRQPQNAPQQRQQGGQRQEAPQQRQAPQNRTQGQNSGTQHATGPAGSIREARQVLGKLMTLYGLCYDAAVASAFQIYDRHGYAIMPGAVGIMADKYLMEAIRRVSWEGLPTSNQTEYKGRPLSELLPFLEQALDQNLARRTAVEEQARHAPQEQRQQSPTTHGTTTERPPQPQERYEQEELPQQQQRRTVEELRQDGQDGSFRDGLEDDDIPF